MDTLADAVAYMRHNETPFWWVKSGNNKVADNTVEPDINSSMEKFQTAMQFMPGGSYKLECSRNPKDRSGSYFFPFSKGQTSTTANTMQPAQQSSNPWGISDIAYKNITDEVRHKVLVEQLVAKMGDFLDEWPGYKKKIDILWNDEDGDGTPDFMQMTQKVSEVVKAGSEVKKVFEGGKLFG